MKKLLFVLFSLICFLDAAQAASQLGITPCTPSSQPADLAFTGTSANVQMSKCGETVIAFNNSTSDARFRIGSGGATTALTTDLLLPSKTFVTLNVGLGGLFFAAIGAGGGTISFIQGTAGN